MARPVIVSATRTAIGTLGGALAQLPATKLGAIAVRDAVRRAKLEPGQVEEVILGHVLPAGLGLNPGRVRSEEHTSELQSHVNLVCRLLLEKKNNTTHHSITSTIGTRPVVYCPSVAPTNVSC